MFPAHAQRLDAEPNLSSLLQRIERNLSSTIPKFHQALAPVRQDIFRLQSKTDAPNGLPIIGKVLEEAQKGWQKSLAVNAFSSNLGLSKNLLPKLPSLAFPSLALPSIKLPNIDWGALQARDESALRLAAQNNWFVQPEFPYPMNADIDACGDNTQKLDDLFMETMRQLLVEIRDRLIGDHPGRAPIIDEMFQLHNERRYIASIPLALMCSEGIALEVAEASIFNLDKNRPAIAKWLDKQKLSGLAKAFAASLSEKHPMSKPREGKLSRHLVLHGRDVKYGSELFSLQAISLLGFVGWAFTADVLAAKSI